MLTFEEIDRLRELLNQLPDHQETRNIQSDVSHRSRDEKGRFLSNQPQLETKEELQSRSDRPRKVIKVEGSYNSYLIKDRWFTDGEIDALIAFGIIGILAIVF